MTGIIELKKFREYKNKLLHTNEEFLGFDPAISIPLEMPRTPESGESSKRQSFIVGDESFLAILSTSPTSANASGCKNVSIYRNKKRIIFFEKGGHGYGTSYSQGKNYFIEGGKAYILVKGIWLKSFEALLKFGEINSYNYYLLVFSDIVIPIKYPLRKIKSKSSPLFQSKKKHVASKIKLWEGVLQTPDGVIHAICTTIHALENVMPRIKKPRGFVEFIIDGQPYYFENI